MNELLIQKPMNKKHNRLHHRNKQQQRQRRKTILIITASSLACLCIVLTIFFNTSKVEKSMAAVSIYTITDADPVVEKTLDAPFIKEMPAIGPNTILVRKVKAEKPVQKLHD